MVCIVKTVRGTHAHCAFTCDAGTVYEGQKMTFTKSLSVIYQTQLLSHFFLSKAIVYLPGTFFYFCDSIVYLSGDTVYKTGFFYLSGTASYLSDFVFT